MTEGSSDEQKVWRYMSFSRFMWLLQTKRLWLARADTFTDPWEVSLTQSQIDLLVRRHPITPQDSPSAENAIERIKRICVPWREDTFVNCWSAFDHESHALWRIFCGANEGVAIQTTMGKLRQAFGNIPIHTVVYGEPDPTTPDQLIQAKFKRPAFAYEHEVRIIATGSTNNPNLNKAEFGFEYLFDLAIIDAVAIHPEANESFKETVTRAVDHYEPDLRQRVGWSTMRERPPLR